LIAVLLNNKKKIMSKIKIAIALLIISTGISLVSGCYKVKTLVIQNLGQEVTTTVSISNEIIPIFSKNCSVSGCHSSGGIKPDLSAEKAYNTLINGNYVDVSNPEKSEIYLWLTGKRNTAMPVGAASNPSNINQLILAWVKQGAKNN
jgi:hypothetical protein